VESSGIEDVLATAEDRLRGGKGLDGTGFRAALAAVKANPEMAERYSARFAAIDQTAFRKWALLIVPLVPGTMLALLVTGVGVVMMSRAPGMGEVPGVIVFFLGYGVVLVTTHGLAHLVVGLLVGIGFTHWFIPRLSRPNPGVKVDYRSYLTVTPRRRAIMHASGAVFTKLVAIAAPVVASIAGLPAWAVWALVGIAVVTVVTDLFWSTKSSDWARVKREMATAHTP
jgi:hypothetical protein